MGEAISWVITLLIVALLLALVGYIVSMSRAPSRERPKTPTYNRFGESVGDRENPDYHVNPGEQ